MQRFSARLAGSLSGYPFRELTFAYRGNDVTRLRLRLDELWRMPFGFHEAGYAQNRVHLDTRHAWLFSQYARFFMSFSTAYYARNLALKQTVSSRAFSEKFRFQFTRKLAASELSKDLGFLNARSERGMDKALRGQRLLLAGPTISYTSLHNFSEAYDVLAVPNPGNLEELADYLPPQKIILYLNTERARHALEKEIEALKSFRKVVVSSRKDFLSLDKRVPKASASGGTRPQIRVIAPSKRLSLNDYGLFLGIRALHDLTLARPACIAIKGFSMYLGNHHPSGSIDAIDRSRKLRLHEPFSNFVSLEKIVRSKVPVIDVECELQSILEAGAEGYAEMLDKQFKPTDDLPA